MHPSDYHGLKNLGSTCYLNSVLQVLFMTKDFREAIFSCGASTTGSIDPHLKKLFDDLKRCTTYPEGIKRELGIDNVVEQRDAAEYFERILSLTSPNVSQIFKGQLRHITMCTECDKRSNVESPFWTLPLSMEDTHGETYGVSDGFEAFLRPSEVSGDNKLYCDNCNAKANATIGCEIKHYPEVLTLLLKRFTFDYCSMSYVKINSYVNFPQTLKKENRTYDLYAVVHHSGSLRGGHYHTTIKPSDKPEWYDFDDSSVSRVYGRPFEVTGDTGRSRSAYMLMYRKRKGSQMIENVKPQPCLSEPRISVSSPGDGGVGAEVREGQEGPVYHRHFLHHEENGDDGVRTGLEEYDEKEKRVSEKGQVAVNIDGRQREEDNEVSCALQTGQWRKVDHVQMTEKWTKGEGDRSVGWVGKSVTEMIDVEHRDNRRKDHKRDGEHRRRLTYADQEKSRREGVSTSIRHDLSKWGNGGKGKHVQNAEKWKKARESQEEESSGVGGTGMAGKSQKTEQREAGKRQNSGQGAGKWQPIREKGSSQMTRQEDVTKAGGRSKIKKRQSSEEESPSDKHEPKAEPRDILSEAGHDLSPGKPAVAQSKKDRTKRNNVETQDSIEKNIIDPSIRRRETEAAAQGCCVKVLWWGVFCRRPKIDEGAEEISSCVDKRVEEERGEGETEDRLLKGETEKMLGVGAKIPLSKGNRW